MHHVVRWAAVVYLLGVGVTGAFAQTLTVTNADLQGWTLFASDGTGDEPPPATYLAPGYATPPAGDGSLHLNVGEDGDDASQARTNAFAGTRIADIAALSYSTFTHVDATGAAGDQAPYLLFHVDTDGNLATADVQLWWFEPLYQSTPPVMNAWQTWDARNGGWYTQAGLAGSGPGADVKTFAQILAVAPDATIVASGTGGVRIVTGFGSGAWNHYAGAADEFRFAAGGTDVTYDFEPDATTLVTVTPSELEEWTLTTVDDGPPGGSPSSTIVEGPGTPPLPPGSLRLAVGTDGDDAAEARSDRWDGLHLRDLAALSYATFHESGGSGGQLPYIILRVDYDNDGGQDDLLFFEPVYQSAGFCNSNPQPAVLSGTWQSWDAAGGCWWSVSATAGASPGTDVKPLSTILLAKPDARLVEGASGGSFRVVAGFGAGAWSDFIGYADELRVALEPAQDTTYDFDPDPSIAITGDSVVEPDAGTTPLEFGLTLSHAVSFSVTAQYSTSDGTATVADADYVAKTAQTVTFDPGETSATIVVDVNGDLKFEPDETLFVDLSSPSGATLENAQAEGLIGNDDPEPQISISDVSLEEGDAGTTNFVFNVTLTNPSAQTITVDFETADGTATSPSDYASTSGTLTFDPGEVLQTITVAVVGDVTWERDGDDFPLDETFFVNLSEAVAATIEDAQGTGNIVGDDELPTIAISDVAESEGDSDQGFAFEVTLSGMSDEAIDISYETFEGTAEADEDFSFEAGTLRYEPGETGVKTINIGIFGDLILEPDEEFTVEINAAAEFATVEDDTATGTILNDDEAPTVSVGNASVLEGNTPGENVLEFQVTLSHESEQTVTVSWSTADDTAAAPEDYTASGGDVTIEFNDVVPNLTATITVPVNGDTLFENDETLFVDLTAATNATIDDGRGVGTIRNDDAMPFLVIEDVTESEGDSGGNAFPFRVALSAPSALPVTVDFETEDVTTSGDFTAASGTLTFAPGDIEEFVDVAVAGDTTLEPDETFRVNLGNASGATISDSNALGTILNDDPQPEISIADVALAEGDAGTTSFTFDVTLSNPSSTPITVEFATADDSALAPGDYLPASGTLTFDPGEVLQPVTVNVVGDLTLEPDETFFVDLSNSIGATLEDGQGVGTIQNDEGVPTIGITDVSMAEGDAGTTSFAFEVTLSGPSATPITVDFATAQGTAEEVADYTGESGTLTFAPGDTTETITVDVLGELLFEDDETFTVVLSDPDGAAIADGSGLGTIANDDEPPVISIGDTAEAEGTGGTTSFELEVTLSNPSESTVTVDFSTANVDALATDDYAATSGTLTFAPGDTVKTIVVQVVGDTMFEPDESFAVNLADATGDATIGDGQGAATIENDDGQPTLSIDDVSQAEGDGGPAEFVFTVTLSNPSFVAIRADIATADGTAVSPDDYADGPGEVVIAAGELSTTFTVQVEGDTVAEPDETFFVNLTNPSGATIADGQGLGTIENDDGALADLTVTKTGPASVDVGQPIEYEIAVTNLGPAPATNVVVTDTIPPGTTFVSATPSQGSCSGTTTVTCNLGTLGDGISATIDLVVTAPMVNGEISNTASADSDESDPTVAAGTASTFVVGAPAHAPGIPTVSEWAMILMLMGLAAAAATRLKA